MKVTITGVRFPYKHHNCKEFACVQFKRGALRSEDLDFYETGDFYETAVAWPWKFSDDGKSAIDMDEFQELLQEGNSIDVYFSKKLKSYVVKM